MNLLKSVQYFNSRTHDPDKANTNTSQAIPMGISPKMESVSRRATVSDCFLLFLW